MTSPYKRFCLISFTAIFCLIITIIIYILYIKNSITESEIKEICLTYISNEITTSKNSHDYGTLPIKIMGRYIQLPTYFYHNFISDFQYITDFLNKLNWKELLMKHNYNLIDIKQDVFEQYVLFIQNEESYACYIFNENIDITQIKKEIAVLLKERENSVDLYPSVREFIRFNKLEIIAIQNVNWNFYIRTLEFINKDFKTLILFYIEDLQNLNMIFEKQYLFIKKKANIKEFLDPIVSFITVSALKIFLIDYLRYIKCINKKNIIDFIILIYNFFKK